MSTPERLHARRLARLEPAECFLSGDPLTRCEGRLEAAHYPIPKQTLRLRSVLASAGVPAAVLIGDPGNGLRVCRQHHHALDFGGLVIVREDLPIRYGEFERRYGLEWLTEKVYERRIEAATRIYVRDGSHSRAVWRPL